MVFKQSVSAKLINTPVQSLNKNICQNVNTAEKNQNSIKTTNQNVGNVCDNIKQCGDLKTLKRVDRQVETSLKNIDKEYSNTMEGNVLVAEKQSNNFYHSTTKIMMDTKIEKNMGQEQCINYVLKEDSQIPIKSSATTVITQKQYMENAHIKLKQFDLFAGYGGFTIAGERCGFETIGFSEIDKYANAVLKYHYPNITNYYDISKINWSEVPDFDLLTGGSPCQDLSIAGKRAGLEGARSGLFYEYMRAVKEKRPKYFIWENVKGALSSNKGFDFAAVINEMAEAGYSLWWQVLNAKDFGVPQNRERIFVIGFRDGSPREIFFKRGTTENSIKVVGELNSDTWQKRNESIRRVHSPEGVAPTTPTAQGGGVMTKIISYRDRRRTASLSDTSNCLTARFRGMPDGDGRPAVYESPRIRRLTPTECERLMGLPDGWTSKGIMNDKEVEISDSQRYKLCGNGVVVNVVEIILKEIII